MFLLCIDCYVCFLGVEGFSQIARTQQMAQYSEVQSLIQEGLRAKLDKLVSSAQSIQVTSFWIVSTSNNSNSTNNI
jgi:hypothetical protein